MVCCFNAPGFPESRLCPPPVILLNPQPSVEAPVRDQKRIYLER